MQFIFAFLLIVCFVVYFFYKNGRPENYLLFVVYCLPLMDFKVTPFDYGDLRTFHLITLIATVSNAKSFLLRFKLSDAYIILSLIFVSALVISGLASENPSRSLLSLLGPVLSFTFAAILIRALWSRPDFIFDFIKGLKFACLVGIGFMFIQLIVGPQFSFYETLNQNVLGGESIRFPGFFMDSQLNGIFFAMASFIWLFGFGRSHKFSASQFIMFSIMITALVLSGSRSPMLSLGISIVFLIFFLKGNLRFQIARYTFMGVAAVFLIAATTNTFDRFQQLDDSYDFRRNIWEGAYEISKEHPFFGIGINNYEDYVRKYAQEQSLLVDNNEILFLQFPENGYLKFLVEWGWIAFVCFILLVMLPFIKLFNHYIRNYNVREATIAAAITVCWLISFMSVYSLADSRIVILLASAAAITIVFTEKQVSSLNAD